MTLNGVMAIILHHFIEIGTFGRQLHHIVCDNSVAHTFSAVYNLW